MNLQENALQAMVDGMSAQRQKERAKTQMTLGGLIEMLESMPAKIKMDGLDHPHSYRGYYSDLAFEKVEKKRTVKDTLEMVRGCLGERFQGWKGGDFYMNKGTPIFVAFEGSCGDRIIDIDVKTGKITVAPDD